MAEGCCGAMHTGEDPGSARGAAGVLKSMQKGRLDLLVTYGYDEQ